MKSIEVKFNEAIESLKKANKLDKFREMVPMGSGSTIEVQLNCAEAILSGKVQEAEAARRTVRKHNGAADNGHETFTESAWSEYAEATDPRQAEVKSTMLLGFSEAEARRGLGLPPKEIVALGRHAVAEYVSAKRLRFSEADAVRLAKQRGEYMTEVRTNAAR